ncbi:hypothetical protein D9M69_643790 [compost metagenome]
MGDAAAEFGAGEVGDIAQDPEQRHVGGDIQLLILAIDVQGQHGAVPQTQGDLKGRRCGLVKPARASGYPSAKRKFAGRPRRIDHRSPVGASLLAKNVSTTRSFRQGALSLTSVASKLRSYTLDLNKIPV